MKPVFMVLKIEHSTAETIDVYSDKTKAHKRFVQELSKMHPTWDSLDVEDFTQEYAFFWESGSLQVVEKHISKTL